MIKSKLISKHKNISHGFFDRSGGFSSGVYKSLNCGIGSKDKKKNIKANLKTICKKINCSINNLVLLNQIHSNKVYSINKIPKKKLIGDALITSKKKIALGILTADCAPVFLFDPKKNAIAAIHVGWKGAYKKIIKKSVNNLIKKGSNIENLIAVVGPCIASKSYEVKTDFVRKFLKQNQRNKSFFIIKKNRIFFSLNDYIVDQLKNVRVNNIEIIKKDTYLYKNNFFSSRRTFKKKFNDYGRNISVIMIK